MWRMQGLSDLKVLIYQTQFSGFFGVALLLRSVDLG